MVQALLEGISLCQPQPKLPSELIKFLGRTFCAWHNAIPLLESHVFLFPEVCCQISASRAHIQCRGLKITASPKYLCCWHANMGIGHGKPASCTLFLPDHG